MEQKAIDTTPTDNWRYAGQPCLCTLISGNCNNISPMLRCQGNRALQSTEFSRRRARFREVESQHHEEFIENLFDLDAVAVVAVA